MLHSQKREFYICPTYAQDQTDITANEICPKKVFFALITIYLGQIRPKKIQLPFFI